MSGALRAIARPCAVIAAGLLAVTANATPVNLTGSYSASGGDISGNLQGNYVGNILTLSPLPNASTLNITLDTPAIPVPTPIFAVHGPYCGIYSCTIRGYLNESYTYAFTPWSFGLGGAVEFDGSNPLGGTANLTAIPILSQIGYLTGTATPSFTVTADTYGPFVQPLANASAFVVQAGLNVGNWHVSVDGSGTWASADPGTAVLSRTESATLTTLGVSVTDIMLDGTFDYDSDLTFDSSIIDLVGSAFISLFRDAVDIELTNLLVDRFNASGFASLSSDEYAADCSASRTDNRSAAISCLANANFVGSVRTPASTAVPEPPSSALFGLGLAGLIWIRQKRRKDRGHPLADAGQLARVIAWR